MKQELEIISENLKRIRETRGLTLEQLSEITGVSKSMLRQIETGKSIPTIATIWKIANGLKVSFTYLMVRQKKEVIVKKLTEGKMLSAEKGKYRIYPVIPFDPKRAFEMYYMEIDPGTIYKSEPHEGETEEIIIVQEGNLIIEIENKEYSIKKDELLKFNANVKHIYKNPGDTLVKAIIEIVYP
ncbi:helix-turn-helix domain-containing protein [Deferribacter autotrophicus]|uniref:Helix-turn-helix domain-containing protein n=1 Tax=Deferribacter autotrophicus TaxID=500465 RepID=A0A5A8F7D0_9BACT|nr:XRE family transcriptional regulator [Deferribacter autotrophicus]KAA0259523.1 helix-turn-helix domain-containing protein [Deferribacter autotrophicus]